MSTYWARFDGEWVDVTADRFLACCDCGCVHREEYRIVTDAEGNDHIIRRVVRDNRGTAARRRSLKMKKEGLWSKKKKKR